MRVVPHAKLTVIVLAAAALFPAAARAGDPIVARSRPDAPAPAREGRVDHSALDALLRKHVDERGLVDYAAWKASDRPALERYLAAMAAVKPGDLAQKQERLAYWINVYNALVLDGMLHFYPTKSVKDHVSHLYGFNFWDDVRIEVEGKERALNAIEHEILRKMGEPRIHFAIVCASLGCPKLRNEAYTGARLEAQLEQSARDFFRDPQKFRIDVARGEVHLSSILKWFGEDFGGTDRSKLDFAARYVALDAERAFLKRDDLSIGYLDYDWGINDRKTAGKP